ncbi:hypothetical protein [Gordonia aichiensis]|uniref:hypothetical protein n=1 Tax=Gordonia aichiensis TaxID=36820 RepID=UPI0012F83E7B|nr:hypothetical protein [Gordonia aichiensis]
MSYDFVFWAGGDALDPRGVYPRLIADQPVTGIDAVDRELIVATFADALPGWRWDGQILQPPKPKPTAYRLSTCGSETNWSSTPATAGRTSTRTRSST